ncbi:MAG: DUF4835 family protein [Muribaculaceae bacterium]|nr:DUF4835 family protein [Muribaculaceae bacterium]
MRLKRLVTLCLMVVACLSVWADEEGTELKCEVEVNASKIQNVSKEVFNTLQQSIAEYINETRWTDAQFSVNEKIVCKLLLIVNKYDQATGKLEGELTIQSQRPVYNSSYLTTLINFKDTKVAFDYQEGDQLVFNEQDMESNLTAILNFYAYMILAIDFDSFALNGGEPYYEKAAAVVRMAQSTGESGWKAFEDPKNRSAVLSAYTDKATSGIREIIYNYHRQGLDQMVVAVDKGRQVITKQIETLKAVYDAQPMSVCLSMFKDAKFDELVNIYSKANQTEKDQVYEILNGIYPAEQERLNKIKAEPER